MYIRVNDNGVDKYPYTIKELKKDYPNISFPKNITPEQLNNFGVYEVALDIPEKEKWEKIVKSDVPKLIDGVWSLVYTTETLTVDQIFNIKMKELDVLYKKNRYSNITINFPSGDAVVQFRNEQDITNFNTVVMNSLVLSGNGSGDTDVFYRTEDDVVQTLTANEMCVIGQTVSSIHQDIISSKWIHKDTMSKLKELNEYQQLIDYDITVE